MVFLWFIRDLPHPGHFFVVAGIVILSQQLPPHQIYHGSSMAKDKPGGDGGFDVFERFTTSGNTFFADQTGSHMDHTNPRFVDSVLYFPEMGNPPFLGIYSFFYLPKALSKSNNLRFMAKYYLLLHMIVLLLNASCIHVQSMYVSMSVCMYMWLCT